jgi:hypothetical protein
MEGKLAIGANATVDYRTVGSNNFATRVVVRSASGLRAE